MVQCEMCGKETNSPNTVKIEGAELQVCDECAEFGTEVKTQQSSTSTKYSTGSSGSSSSGSSTSSSTGGASGSSSSGGSGGGRRRRDMFDEMDEVAQDYDNRIRSAREAAGLSQEELAKKLNEKASLIRKLEHGEILPSDDVQRKLERELDIDLSAGATPEEDTDWEGGSASGEYTLGDVVERKD
ncbi:multiprotein bridging factor aMBF1 [Halapricum desulfuricans]|uniref:Putative transcription factor n=1 Tax=Halapricum desulfuricans TaxID=2841257 RepID=A0A897N2P9_9EURY|nr:multiprotein bridging factor aMBF1 [Halapricum desulfuricans]QSG06498.1 putative transcription factor [Halapricum desulfuricans]